MAGIIKHVVMACVNNLLGRIWKARKQNLAVRLACEPSSSHFLIYFLHEREDSMQDSNNAEMLSSKWILQMTILKIFGQFIL